MFLLRVLLIAIIVYLPTHETFGFEFTLKGLNVINMLFLFSLLTLLAVGTRSKSPTPLKGQFLLFFAMLGWAFLVGAMRDPSALVDDLTMLKNSVFYMLLFFLVYHSAQDLKTVWVLFATVLLVTFLASLQGLQQAAAYGLSVYDEARRVSAPFGDSPTNANRSAMFFAIFLPLFAAVALFCKSRPVLRIVAAGCFALGTFVVFFTYSRQAYVILALLALLLAVRRNLFVSLLIGVAVLNYQVWAPDTAVTRLQMTQKSGGADSGYVEPVRYDESTASRFVLWQGAAEMLVERPWGTGLNHFKREIGHYVPQYAGKDAHNFYVLITAEAGPFGLIATGVLLMGLLRLGRQVRTVDGSETSRMLGIGYTMSVFAVMLSNVYGSRFLDHDVMGNFWILTALVARYYSLMRESAARPAAQPAAQVPGLRRPVPAL